MGSPLSPKTLRVAGQAMGFTDEAGDAIRQLSKPIRAYHGSPHSFDAFDASKIGTGEGAQAYGHGLYFAGNERVARAYRDNIPAVPSGPTAQALQELSSRLLPLELEGARIRDAMDDAAELRGDLSPGWGNIRGVPPDVLRELGPRLQSVNDEINKLRMQEQQIRQGLRGHMYEVEIGHPEESLLDWDKPIYGQSDAVIDGLKRLNARALGAETELLDGAFGGLVWRTPRGNIVGTPTRNAVPETLSFWDTHQNHRHGGAAISDLNALKQSPTAASEALRSVGIPGIRYLDGGSRAAGDGTRNYVIFPGAEDRIRILRKFGLLGPAAMAGTNSEEN